MATYQTGWSDGKSNFGAALSNKDASQFFSLPISTINTAISSIGSNYQINSITIYASIYVENSALGTYTCRVGYGGSGNIGTQLNATSSGTTMTWNGSISASLNAAISGNRLNVSYGGGYITFHIDTAAWGKKTYKVSNVYVDVSYSEKPKYYVAYSANGGSGTMATDTVYIGDSYSVKSNSFTAPTVSMTLIGAGDNIVDTKSKSFSNWLGSNGTYYSAGQSVSNLASSGGTITMSAQWGNPSFTLPAVADTETDRFLGWYFDNTVFEAGYTFSSAWDIQFVAVWEAKKIKKVYGGNTQATVYVANTECKAVYVGNIKIYG